MPTIVVTPEALVLFAGVLLSLCFSYIPKLNVWFAAKSEEFKKLFMLGLLLIVTLGIFLLGCFKIVPVEAFTCDQQTAVKFFYMFVLALISNQSTYKISPMTNAVKQAKLLPTLYLK